MRESIGKSTARKIFFEEVLARGLSSESLANGNMLLLLGDEPRELPYVDAVGISRANIWSVERLSEIYRKQIRQKLGIHLSFGEMGDFLRSILQSNQEFLIFNLDIEGSYLSQRDAAMASVILLCLRNPETLVGTYSSVGRDTEMLWEGIKSFAIFLWLAKDETLVTFSSLYRRYERIGFLQPANMVFRDFFWLRSMLEHTLVTSAMVGSAAQKLVHRWFVKVDLLWNSVARWKRRPLRLHDLVKMVELAVATGVDKKEIIVETPSCLCSSLASFTHVMYHAERPWSQLCYFAKLKVLDDVISGRTWLREGLSLFLAEPLIFIDRDGSRRDLQDRVVPDEAMLGTVLWNDNDLYRIFRPRRLPVYPASERLIGIMKTSLVSKDAKTFLNRTDEAMQRKEVNDISRKFLDAKGKLTDFGKTQLQAYGRQYKELSVSQILELLPRSARKIPEKVVRAHIAVARRKKK